MLNKHSATRSEILAIIDTYEGMLKIEHSAEIADRLREWKWALRSVDGPVCMVKRAEFRTLTGARKVAILNSAGKVEVYRIEDGGLEMFEGYITDRMDPLWLTGAASALDRAPAARSWLTHVEPRFGKAAA